MSLPPAYEERLKSLTASQQEIDWYHEQKKRNEVAVCTEAAETSTS
jgi:hypothetical protein